MILFVIDVQQAIENGWNVIGTVVENSSQCPERQVHSLLTHSLPKKPTLLVLGNESMGLARETLEACSLLYSIPSGGVDPDLDSINVSVGT